MATLPNPAQLVEAAKKNGEAVRKIVRDNPQAPGTATPVPSTQGATPLPQVKP